MSDVVGGSERKTVCVMSSHFLCIFMYFHYRSKNQPKLKRGRGKAVCQTPHFIKYNAQNVLLID